MDKELRGKIADSLHRRDAMLRWQPGYYADADQVLALIEEAGYVRLADDQSLPQNNYWGYGSGIYHTAQVEMYECNWRKVEL